MLLISVRIAVRLRRIAVRVWDRLIIHLSRPSIPSGQLLRTAVLRQMRLMVQFEVVLQLLILCLIPMQIDLALRALHRLQLREDLREQRLLLEHLLHHLINVLLAPLQRLFRLHVLVV